MTSTEFRRRHALVIAVALTTAPFASSLLAESTGNILINPGAETGNLTGWSLGGSSNPRIDNGSFDSGISPLAGNFDFLGGSGPSGSLVQAINFNGFTPTFQQVDNAQVSFALQFAERSLGVTVGLTPDGAGVALSSNGPSPLNFVSPELQSTSNWQGAGTNAAIPAGARTLTYTMYFNRHTGTDLDAFIDANILSISYPGSSWKGSATGNWSNASLWNSGLPVAGAPALLTWPGGPVTVTFDGNYASSPLTELYLDAPASGMSLSQANSTMSAGTEYVGNVANATYTQSGGTNNTGDLFLGFYDGSHGTYSMFGGQLNAGNSIHVGGSGNGTFALASGTVNTISAFVGDMPQSNSTLSITGGTFNTVNLTVGPGLAQTTIDGGNVTVQGTLSINPAAARIVNLNSGSLSLSTLDLNGVPSHFHWTGGTLIFLSDFALNNASPIGVNLSLNHSQTLAVNGIFTLGAASNPTSTLTVQGTAALDNLYAAPVPGSSANVILNDPAATLSANNAYIGGTNSGSGGIANMTLSAGTATLQHLTLWLNGSVVLNGGTLAVNTLSFSSGGLTWTSGTLRFLSDQVVDPNFVFGNAVHVTASQTLAFSNLFNDGALVIDPAANLTASVLSNEFTGTITAAGRVTLAGTSPSTNIGTINISGPFQTAAGLINYASLTLSGAQSWSPSATFTNDAGFATFASPAKLAALTINGGSVDLTATGKLIVQSTAVTKSTLLASLRNDIATHALTSSTIPANFGLALVDNAITSFSTFGNLPVDPNSLLLSPELLGDTNVDGKVDLTDLSTVLNNFGSTTPNWTSGNFDNQPTIDLTDLSDVLNNFGATSPTASVPTAPAIPTPEPASLALLSGAALALLARRRPPRS